ncbi:hypothetical protein GOV08_02510, partial [Candidatus Woesearchaeota archaeon]|nr:hypothetical protein [Candidatus Woesearchaeota archaeon]
MRKTTALILLLLLSSIVYAEEDLTLKDELLVNLEISSSIGVDMYSSNSYLNNVKVELNYHPKDSYRQDVRSLEAFPNAKIDDMIIFEWENPKTYPLTFSLNSRIETKSDFVKVKKKI